jgi:hypothetical protein
MERKKEVLKNENINYKILLRKKYKNPLMERKK